MQRCIDRGPPRQNVRFVVSRGKLWRRLKRMEQPNCDRVPVPVLSPLFTPFLIMLSTMFRYCTCVVAVSLLASDLEVLVYLDLSACNFAEPFSKPMDRH